MRKLLLASAATMGALLAATGGAQAQPVTQPAPGTIAVHLNGYLQFAIGDYGSTFNTYTATGSTATTKLNPVTTNGDARLYAGFDAATLNGINYGAQIELRTTTSNSGQSSGSNTTNSSGTESIYVKRAYGYLGTSQAGYVRLGQTDSAFSLLQSGVVEGFGDGAQFNADGGIINAVPSNTVPGNFVFADQSKLYATDKIVYLSPKIANFSMGVGFEPSSNGLKEGTANCATAATTCSSVSSYSSSTVNYTARKNTIDAALMYAANLHGFLTKASVGVLNAAPVNDTYPGVAQVKGMTVYQAGAQTTFAGLTVGANVKWGSVEDGYAFIAKGARNGLTYIANATYVVGPYVVGASFYDGQTAGAWTSTNGMGRTMSEYGVAVGGNYVIGKDLSLFTQYLYGHRHQANNNIYASNGTLSNGNAQVQLIETGATFKW
jgi:hypothetical protein